MDCASRTEGTSMRDIIEEMIYDRGMNVREFLEACSCCASFLRPRKGELGFNPYVLTFIDLANNLHARPSEICLLYEGRLRSIPRRKSFDYMEAEWTDIADAVREYVDILIKRSGIDISGDHEFMAVLKRYSSYDYGHRIRLLSINDIIVMLGGRLSDFFLLLERGSLC